MASPSSTAPAGSGQINGTVTPVNNQPSPLVQQQVAEAGATQPYPLSPPRSVDDPSSLKRPRDARLIHMVLTNLGVSSYQERVPLQLMDFAYRYTASALVDAAHVNESQISQGTTGSGGRGQNTSTADGSVSLAALRLSLMSRTSFQFQPTIPKEFLLDMAHDKNKMSFPKVEAGFGPKLPPDRYCLTGVGWGLKDQWESEEGTESMEAEGQPVDVKMEDNAMAEAEFHEAVEGEDLDMTDA